MFNFPLRYASNGTYPCFEIDIEPVGDVNGFIPPFDFFVQIDLPEVVDFSRLENVINSNVALCILCEDSAFVIQDSIVSDGCSTAN